ncbi:MAG TPA: sel1 repeat family protein [Gallibacterium anatis]|uniref:Sel1 repeat family protein n=1 Tax=Gallibacterium anatis TaxID=750 RepID=A0A921L0I0_9PAST|nr:sel1 repeat family protein [Gallibacterium anatis]
MKFTKTLLTTALFSFSVLSASPMAYAVSDPKTQFQQAVDAYERSDFITALQLWKPLAEQGDANAQFNLALMYEDGKGVKQDYFQTVKWYQKAAEQGNAKAQFNLGIMYSLGQGVKKDRNLAKMWVSKACENGYQKSRCDVYRMLNEGE